MTAKEKQMDFIKSYLKPTLKVNGYKTSGQTWWKNMGDFFIVINLQNSQWNSKDELSFCFNIGVALTENLKDKEKKKASYSDLVAHVRHEAYITEERHSVKAMRGGLGYQIMENTNLTEFVSEFKVDLEDNILKILNGFKTLSDCVAFYEKYSIWGDIVKRQIEERGLVYSTT